MYTQIDRRKINSLTKTVAGFVLSVTAWAQVQPNAMLSGMAENAKQLRQYTFKQRTETYHKGELRNAKLDEVHYSVAGERISIPLEEQREQAEPRRRGPGARIVAKKVEEKQHEIKDYAERLMSLTSRYLASDPARLQSAMSTAEVTTGGSTSEVRIALRDYVKKGDLMTMSFDPRTKRPTKTEVTTVLDESPVFITLSFDQIREGPTYPGRTVVKSAAKELEIRVLTYDYRL